MSALAVLLALPCLLWTAGAGSAPSLKEAGITQVCVPAAEADSWRDTGITVTPVTEEALADRQVLLVPGTVPRAGIASPTRAPWINANGWRIRRNPQGRFRYELPAGKAALAAAEASAYGGDAVLAIATEDLPRLGNMLSFLKTVPPSDLPDVADFGVVDDGSPEMGEVMNLLSRRNLLFERVKAPSSRYRLTVHFGPGGFDRAEAADPSAFALKLRRQLTDEERSLRIYGSEVVVGRLTAGGGRARLHLLNYGGRPILGLRVRIRGEYSGGEARVPGAAGTVALTDHVVADGFTEFTLPELVVYAVVDLR
ncbi:MAG TPA: hypothetical protein VIL35_09590 [Vicinamibacterales bacterium]